MSDLDGRFEEFWGLYGRIGNKQKAKKAWGKIKGVSYGEIIRGHEGYVRYCANTDWYNKQHCATWLNSEGWDSEWAAQPAKLSNHERAKQALGLTQRSRRPEELINVTPDLF